MSYVCKPIREIIMNNEKRGEINAKRRNIRRRSLPGFPLPTISLGQIIALSRSRYEDGLKSQPRNREMLASMGIMEGGFIIDEPFSSSSEADIFHCFSKYDNSFGATKMKRIAYLKGQTFEKYLLDLLGDRDIDQCISVFEDKHSIKLDDKCFDLHPSYNSIYAEYYEGQIFFKLNHLYRCAALADYVARYNMNLHDFRQNHEEEDARFAVLADYVTRYQMNSHDSRQNHEEADTVLGDIPVIHSGINNDTFAHTHTLISRHPVPQQGRQQLAKFKESHEVSDKQKNYERLYANVDEVSSFKVSHESRDKQKNHEHLYANLSKGPSSGLFAIIGKGVKAALKIIALPFVLLAKFLVACVRVVGHVFGASSKGSSNDIFVPEEINIAPEKIQVEVLDSQAIGESSVNENNSKTSQESSADLEPENTRVSNDVEAPKKRLTPLRWSSDYEQESTRFDNDEVVYAISPR